MLMAPLLHVVVLCKGTPVHGAEEVEGVLTYESSLKLPI